VYDWILVVALWLPVLALVIYDLIRNEPHEEEALGATADERHLARERLHWRRQERSNGFTGLFSSIAAVAAVFAAVFAGYVYVETRNQVAEAKRAADEAHRQANAAEDTEERQLRAYVALGEFKKVEKFGVGEKPHLIIGLDNVGQTPVYEATWNTGIGVFNYPMPADLPVIIVKLAKDDPDPYRRFFTIAAVKDMKTFMAVVGKMVPHHIVHAKAKQYMTVAQAKAELRAVGIPESFLEHVPKLSIYDVDPDEVVGVKSPYDDPELDEEGMRDVTPPKEEPK
jgi:hypothetical protein